MKKVNEKVNGVFEFKHEGQTFKGCLKTWTLGRFSERMGINSIDELFTLFTQGFSLKAIAGLYLTSVEYYYVKEKKEFTYTIDDAYDWIDSIGIGKAITLLSENLAEVNRA